MVTSLKMKKWTNEIEDELAVFIKEWLKHSGRTQADLCLFLNASNTRMSSLLEILKKDYDKGGISKIAQHLSDVERSWAHGHDSQLESLNRSDPLGQLDLLLDEIKEDCDI